MKYLKTYNESVNVRFTDIVEDIKDILMDLEDDGYYIGVYWSPIPTDVKKKLISIQINKMNKPLFVKNEEELELLSSTLERLERYLVSSNFKIRSFFFDNSEYNRLTCGVEKGESFKSIFHKFWFIKKHKERMFEFTDIGDYIQIGLLEK